MKLKRMFPCVRRCMRPIIAVTFIVLLIKMMLNSRAVLGFARGIYRFEDTSSEDKQLIKFNKAWQEEMTKVFEERKARLISTCNAIWRGPKQVHITAGLRQDLLLDRKHGLAFCRIGKAASTFWTRVLQITSGNQSKSSPFDIPLSEAAGDSLKQFIHASIDQFKHLLTSSTKFLFVRDPYARLFSSYIDKLFTPRPSYSYLRKKILRISRWKVPKNIPKNGCATYVTFAEFVNFVVQTSSRGGIREKHFMTMNELCQPCQIPYDIVGKMETLMNDAEFILKHIGYEDRINIAHKRSEIDAINDIVNSVFNDRIHIEREHCVSFGESLDAVWRKVIIRGMIFRQETMPLEFLDGNVSREQFRTAIMEAFKRSSNKTERLGNRRAALIEAYKSLPVDDLKKIQEIHRLDFEIFGYDMQPPDIFSAKLTNPEYSFFSDKLTNQHHSFFS